MGAHEKTRISNSANLCSPYRMPGSWDKWAKRVFSSCLRNEINRMSWPDFAQNAGPAVGHRWAREKSDPPQNPPPEKHRWLRSNE